MNSTTDLCKRILNRTAVTLAVGATFLPAGAGVLSGPIINPANGHTYYLLTQNTWTASEAEALALGGHLITINNAAENTWALQTFSTATRKLWTGLNDAAVEGSFVWSSGEPVTYTNWWSAAPNNLAGVEHYVHVYEITSGFFAGLWNDYCNCTTESGVPLHGVVEITPVPETPTVALMLLGMTAMANRMRKFIAPSSPPLSPGNREFVASVA